MRNIVTVAFLLIFGLYVKSQDINYHHKSVSKEINRLWKVNDERTELTELNNKDLRMGKFFELKANENKFIYIGRVNSCRAGGCAVDNHNSGPSEYFDYLVCFSANGMVEGVKVFNYAATHGYEIVAKGWLKQFSGYSSEQNLEVGKNVDSISGATISVFAITDDVKAKTQLLSKYLSKKSIF
ncbi:FMN-binding protein [Plebeiibacterium sediminum]|uniref:FMN-binding protein n=1 Tax=Plebeiibacterium sediminum TaxID=2992112 RepID=A0AAE3M752_9BACT|nr:FMN-binding protein [Plebeiobacterium sediminum]MCW3788034.1 FMN-binding protein [Plebeiobacterium sediminum]